ncbi:MAG TPA: phytanoyl-CoA dioxygenase family protein [Novosphingobium sp.]|nr:phytanoyl-CoA dioxygenase family protein [Novosphingobium sp.]
MPDISANDVHVRAITDEETEFFYENGWVHLPSLIDRETAAELLRRAQLVFGADGRKGLENEAPVTEYWQAWLRTKFDSSEDEYFKALSTSSQLGENAARLLGRDSSIRMMLSNMSVKLPKDSGKGNPTDFHQDTPGHAYLEGSFLTAWVALDEVQPDMGAMQFYSRSHRIGNLGNLKDNWDQWAPHLERSCSLSGPVALQPGDATIHRDGTIHGTYANVSGRPRWSWASVMVPGDARYTGAANPYTDGLGFEPFGQLDHPRFPIIYTPKR